MRRLTRTYAKGASWSPDGRRIVFAGYGGQPINVINADGMGGGGSSRGPAGRASAARYGSLRGRRPAKPLQKQPKSPIASRARAAELARPGGLRTGKFRPLNLALCEPWP